METTATCNDSKTFIITEDLEVILRNWGKRRNFQVPSRSFLSSLHTRLIANHKRFLEKYWPGIQVRMLFYDEIRKSILSALQKLDFPRPFVSFDELYFPEADYQVGVTRAIEYDPARDIKELEKEKIVASRPGFPPLSDQISEIIELAKSRFNSSSVSLLDDGCWDGSTLSHIANRLEEKGIAVIGATAIKICRENAKPIAGKISVLFEEFPGSTEWICERDYFPGIHRSGRTILIPGKAEDFGISYLTFPEKPLLGNSTWAGTLRTKITPADGVEFSQLCLDLTAKLFEEIERISGRSILWQDIERRPVGVSFGDDERYVDILRNYFMPLLRIE